MKDGKDGPPSEPVIRVLSGLSTFVLTPGLFSIKDPCFKAEKEWRIICIPKLELHDGAVRYQTLADWDVRELRGLLVPHTTLRPIDGMLPVRSITCGPSRNASLSRDAIELFLRSKKYAPTISVGTSRVPLRWE